MRIRSLVMSVTVVFASLLALAVIALAADPFVGTWKVNVAKSKALSPNMLPKNETIKNEGIDNGLKATCDGLDAEGKAYHILYSVKYDGKDYSFTGDPKRDTISAKKIDPSIAVFVYKKAGKEVATCKCTITKDGKTATCSGKAKDAKGQDVAMDIIYEKQ
jgi:hypothetical protein